MPGHFGRSPSRSYSRSYNPGAGGVVTHTAPTRRTTTTGGDGAHLRRKTTFPPKTRTVTTGGASPFGYTGIPKGRTTTGGITGSDKFRKFLSRFNPLKKAPIEYIYPSEHDEFYSGLESGEISTSNYHRDVTEDYWRNVSKNWADINPLLGAAVNVGAPAGTMIGGLGYDVGQGLARYQEKPNKYLSPFMQNVKATQFDPSVTEALGARGVTDISGVDLIGSGRAVAAEQPIKSNLQRMAGSVEPLLSAWGLGNTLNYANGGLVDLYRHGGF